MAAAGSTRGWRRPGLRQIASAGASRSASLADVLVTRLDVQERDSIGVAIEAGIAGFGKIDALINNAGFGLFGLFEATPREKIEEQFDVNVFGVMAQ
jgi:NAD(P)-dependent dehydrogenase (short-subunit alcohol dehydrogenase family)